MRRGIRGAPAVQARRPPIVTIGAIRGLLRYPIRRLGCARRLGAVRAKAWRNRRGPPWLHVRGAQVLPVVRPRLKHLVPPDAGVGNDPGQSRPALARVLVPRLLPKA